MGRYKNKKRYIISGNERGDTDRGEIKERKGKDKNIKPPGKAAFFLAFKRVLRVLSPHPGKWPIIIQQ
jgi:hypothetical protein